MRVHSSVEDDLIVKEGVAMDQLYQLRQCEVEASEASPEKVKWEPPSPGKQQQSTPSKQRRGEDCNCGSPKMVQFNLKPSLVVAQIADEDEELFLRRQSSLSSMFSAKMRSSPGKKRSSIDQSNVLSPRNQSGVRHSPSPSKRIPNENNGGIASPGSRNRSEVLHSLSPSKRVPNESNGRISCPGSRNHSGLLSRSDSIDHPQPLSSHTSLPANERLPSGNLYPCAGNPDSALLNVAHFTFDNSSTLAPENNNLTERIFKKLMGQSRLHRSSDERKSPVSTLEGPKSPSFRVGKSKRKSLRSRVEDANTEVAANPRPKSQLAQYLRSITASNLATDDDNLEGPSEVAWLEPDSPYHSDRSYASTPKKNESWSSNSSTWNLSLNPLRTVSTIVSRRHQQTPRRKLSRLGESKADAITRISLTGSYDGSYSTRSRSGAVRKGSELSSGWSWWSEIGSGRRSTSIWTCSGRLQMESLAEPDLHEPDMAQANVVKQRQVDGARPNVNSEAAFAFSEPIASSFMFQGTSENSESSTPDAASLRISRASTDLHKTAVVTDSENEFDMYHDPDDRGSITDSEVSPHWDAIRKHSFDYVREVAVGSSGLSSRALSRLLLIERPGMESRDGRFSVDLQRGQKLDKAMHPRTPDVKLRIFASEKAASKRSILLPCLPFLQRSPHNHKPDSIQEATAPPSRRLQAMNSFTARLGPVSETSSLAGPIYVQ